jgi:kojibiose phosphorylase
MLWREWRQKDPYGRITRFNSCRFASLSDRRLLIQRSLLTAENYCLDLEIESSYDLDTSVRALALAQTNAGTGEDPGPIPIIVTSPGGAVRVAFYISSRIVVSPDAFHSRELKLGQDRIVEVLRIQGGVGAHCELHRFVSVINGQNDLDPQIEASRHTKAVRSRGIDSAFCSHRSEWRAGWKAADLQIEGDSELQQAVRFAVYHLISAANPGNDQTSIGARALTGNSYRGHVFWDTEIYMLPFYVCTEPASARALLGYRYRTLPAARDKARAAGYQGAMYAWESADTGEDVTPTTAITPGGEVIPIRNGEMEVHITADIAYAVWQYWKGTADDVFLLDYGAELLLESARFWASRGAIERDGCYHIRHVIGPDEYHEDVDDNAFTNLMAAWNLRCGAEIAELLRDRWTDRWNQLTDKLLLAESEAYNWAKLADAIAIRYDPATLVYEQFAGYYEKEHVDLRDYEPRVAAIDTILGYQRVQQTDIVKQPDVMMAIYLLWDQFPPEVREANFRFYEPRTGHGSSLSPSIHALIAARLGDMELAEHYLRQASEIDLGNTMGNAAGGVHAAAIGGLWQAMVFGFAGVQTCDDGVALSPSLLARWKRLSFPFQWRNCRLQITADSSTIRVEAAGPNAIKLRLPTGSAVSTSPQQSYNSIRGPRGWSPWQTFVTRGGARENCAT